MASTTSTASQAELLEFIRDNSFCTLITCSKNKLFTSHINLLQLKGETFFGHLAANNHQAIHLQNGDKVLAIFKNSSAQNYEICAVHLQGTVELISEEEPLTQMLSGLTSKYETGRCPEWSIDWEDPKYRSRLKGIVGFKITCTLIEEALLSKPKENPVNVATPLSITKKAIPTIVPIYTPHFYSELALETLTDFMNTISTCTLVLCSDTGLLYVYHLNQIDMKTDGDALNIVTQMAVSYSPEFLKTENRLRALVIFNGAHTYISPTLYKTAYNVPTWNYAVVHAQGIVHVLGQQQSGSELLLDLKCEVEKLYGKFKLNQKQGKKDKQGVFDGLNASSCPADQDVAQLMKSFSLKM